MHEKLNRVVFLEVHIRRDAIVGAGRFGRVVGLGVETS